MTSMKLQFEKVFALAEAPQDSDVGVVTNWLLTHKGNPPTRRCLAAIKNIESSHGWYVILKHYIGHIRKEVMPLQLTAVTQLMKIREYFLSPMQYIHLTPQEFSLIERTTNSVIKTKICSITELTPEQEDFVASLGMATDELIKLRYCNQVQSTIQSFSRIWDRSFLDQISDDDYSKLQLSTLRISELFDMVLDYPKSIPALQDLRYSMQPSQRNDLVKSFTDSCSEIVLHAGVNTNDIILCFISTIKSFLFVDPVGVLLDTAFRPIKRYLHGRDDTIPLVIRALINPDPTSLLCQLSEELMKEPERTVDDLTLDWEPAPIDALPDFRKQDIIEALISLNDKKVFIEELELVIAERLLTLKTYDISELLKKIKLLKSRFQDNELSKLDVMVRDILQSEDIDRIIHRNDPCISDQLQFSILSHAYWPEFSEERFKPPGKIEQQISLYEGAYKSVKDSRVMTWMNSGQVDIDLEFENKTLSLSVAPLHAAVITCFHDNDSVALDQIMAQLEMSMIMAQKALSFWKEIGIITQDGTEYKIIEHPETTMLQKLTTATPTKQVNHSLDYCWSFIDGMITNLGPMPLTQIQKFLKAVVPQDKGFNPTADDLQLYLQRCVADEKLFLRADKYDLRK